MKINPEIKERIVNTANTLVAEGITEPTNSLVLERMGKGSLSHVSPVMREWRALRQAGVSASLEMPADLKKSIEISLSQVWTSASKLTAITVENVRHEAQVSIKEISDERDEALLDILRLENKISELEVLLVEKDRGINHIKNEVEAEREKCIKHITEVAILTTRLDDRDDQIKNLKVIVNDDKKNNKRLQDELLGIAKKVS